MLNRLLLWMTRRRWNRVASRVLCQAYECGVINSAQMHLLAKEFDPTQNGLVGRLPADPKHTSMLLAQKEA